MATDELTYCPTCTFKRFDPLAKICGKCGASQANGYISAKKRIGRPDLHFERDLDENGRPIIRGLRGSQSNV